MFIHSSTEGLLDYFQILKVMNKATVSFCVKVFVWIYKVDSTTKHSSWHWLKFLLLHTFTSICCCQCLDFGCFIDILMYWHSLLHLFFFFNFFFKFFICSEFCHTLKWKGLGFTCLPHPYPPSHLPPHPLPPGPPRAPGPSACLMHPTWAGNLFHPW